MNSEYRRDLFYLLSMTTVLVWLVFVLFIRPLLPQSPIRGQSAEEVVQLAKARAIESIGAAAIPSDYHICTSQSIAARWKRLQTQDNSLGRRMAIEQARKKFAARTWPIMAQRGYIKDKKCWIVASWHLMNIGFCGNSMLTHQQMTEIVEDACTEIAIVEDDAPHRVLTYTLGDPRIGME